MILSFHTYYVPYLCKMCIKMIITWIFDKRISHTFEVSKYIVQNVLQPNCVKMLSHAFTVEVGMCQSRLGFTTYRSLSNIL